MPKATHTHTDSTPTALREKSQTNPTSPLAADEIKALRDTAGWRA